MNKSLLTRRVEKVLPSKEELEKVISSRKIRLYQGFDPTGGRLHLGHSIGLRKLMDFAHEGHEVIFLFGTGTVLVGDPSQRDTGRKLITQEEIDANIQGWKDQVAPIVDFNLPNVVIKSNGEWLIPLTLKDIIQIGSNITAVQLFKRESFQRRIDSGDTVWFHETMYPLLQGYDSVAMDVDLEIGGTDQEFNMLIGRELQRKMNNREKFVLTVPMIFGTDGHPMSKTRGNAIWLDDTAQDMFGKLMSLPDDQIVPYLELVSDVPMERIGEIQLGLESQSLHPMDAKKELARSVVSDFHGEERAQAAQHHFESTVQLKEVPEEIETITFEPGTYTILDILKTMNVAESNSQIKRTLQQGGVEYNGQKVADPTQEFEIRDEDTVKFGKRTYKKIRINN